MPEAGRTPEPTFKRGDNNLAYGDAVQLNDAVGLVPPPEQPGYTPQGPDEQFLFSPTDHPTEPFTAGLPFGPGPDGVPTETNTDFRARAAQQLAQSPNQPREVKAFLAKMAEGL